MDMKKGMVLFVVGIVLLHVMAGCSQNRAKIRIERGMTFSDIVNDWDKYYIYYAGSSSRPLAILVDIKDDDVKMVGDRWIRVEDKGTLSSLAGAIQTGTSLNKITARSDDKLFGYYSRTEYTETRRHHSSSGYKPLATIVDENTLNVNLVRWENSVPPIF